MSELSSDLDTATAAPVRVDGLRSAFAVVDVVRRRYQMYAGSAAELVGLLLGYALCAGPGFDHRLDELRDFVRKRLGGEDPRQTWTDLIAARALGRDYEISLFLVLLDEFRGTRHTMIAEAVLSHEQRRFDFDRRSAVESIDYPMPVLLPPHRLRAVLVEGVGTQAFFFDARDTKYYEQGFPSFERMAKWAADCFRLTESDWTLHDC